MFCPKVLRREMVIFKGRAAAEDTFGAASAVPGPKKKINTFYEVSLGKGRRKRWKMIRVMNSRNMK